MSPHPETIRSRQNPHVHRARLVRDGREKELIFVEGVRLAEEAVGASLLFDSVLYAESLARDERVGPLLEKLHGLCENVLPISESVLESVSDVKNPQGVIALAHRPRTGREVVETFGAAPLVVIMHRVNNPSNAGAMLRVAEAAGATAAISTEAASRCGRRSRA
ncbi:MAG: hypothetical protein LC802_12245 [Acidobacteria bacterium]|nr:hypothetical protein [Acidobacteriota bacterium]